MQQRLGAIGRRDVEAFLVRLRETGTRRGKKKSRVPLSATTVNYGLAVLKFILRDAVDQGHLGANPAAPVRPVRDPDSNGHDPVRFLEPTEIRRLLEGRATRPRRRPVPTATSYSVR